MVAFSGVRWHTFIDRLHIAIEELANSSVMMYDVKKHFSPFFILVVRPFECENVGLSSELMLGLTNKSLLHCLFASIQKIN